MLKYTFDPEYGCIYIQLIDAPVAYTKQVAPNINVDYDADDRVRGIEVLNVPPTT